MNWLDLYNYLYERANDVKNPGSFPWQENVEVFEWIRCADKLPPIGVFVVAVWEIFDKTTAHVARRGVPGWYLTVGVEMVPPKFWIPLPKDQVATETYEQRRL